MRYLNWGAIFSNDRLYRYRLWRIWNPERKRIAFIMLNPSTTEEHPDTNDPTVRRCISFAEAWGYGSLEIGNLYGFRSTNPDALLDMGRTAIGPDNDENIDHMNGVASMTVAAWGEHPAARQRQPKIRHLLEKRHPIYCLGLTKDGYPRHPLYLESTTRPVEWTH
jgi:hypothetical protein